MSMDKVLGSQGSVYKRYNFFFLDMTPRSRVEAHQQGGTCNLLFEKLKNFYQTTRITSWKATENVVIFYLSQFTAKSEFIVMCI
jgi:hypothetical protein